MCMKEKLKILFKKFDDLGYSKKEIEDALEEHFDKKESDLNGI